MIQFLKSLNPRTQIRLALLLGGAVIALFFVSFVVFLSNGKILWDLIFALAGAFLGLAGMGLSLSVARNLNESLRSERASQERFERFTEITKEGILIHENGIIVDLNQALAEMTGFRAVELVGTDGMRVFTEESAEKVRKFRKTGYPQDPYEITLRRKGGTTIPVEVHGRDFDFEGRKLRVASFWNITERKKAEEALERSEAKFRGLIDNSYDLITVLDRDGKRIYESPSLERILGYKPGERTGNTFETQPEEDLEKARKVFAEVLSKPGVPVKTQLKARHKDGRIVEAEMVSTNFLDDPAIRGIVVNGRDITAEKKAEAALRKSEELFRNLIENSHDVISITGKDRAMSYISPSVKRVLGYEPSEMIGKGYAEIMHPEDVERIKGEFAQLLGTSGVSWTVQFRLKHKNGTWCHVESTGINLLENPAVQGIIYNLRDVTERVQAEAALRKSEEHFRNLIEKSHDVITLVQRDGLTQYVSPSIEKILGYHPEERVGRPFHENVHPDDLSSIQEFFQYLLRNPGVTLTSRGRVRHKDGGWRQVEGSATNLLDNPDIAAIVLNYRDITEKFEAEEAVRHSEENFRNLIEKAPDAVFVTREGGVIYANSKTLGLLGYEEKEELLGRAALDLVHPDDRRTVSGRIQTLNEGGRIYPTEIRMMRRDGAETAVEASSIGIQFEGKPAIMVSLRDITLRKQAEAAARETQQRYRSLVESMPDAVMVHDEENILYVNPSAVRMFGAKSEADLLSKPFWVVVPYEFRETVRTRLRAVMEKGAVNELAERKLRRLDETQIDVLVTSVPFYDRGRRVVLAIFLDITPLKEAERKAQRYQRLAALGEMAAGMAHEIRNPTAAISAQAQYLLKKMEGNGTTYEQLKDILQQCDRLETLVQDTLDYSPEKKFEERAEIPAKELLQKALRLAQTQFGPSHARVQAELDLPRELPLLKVHPTRMDRVLVNLILNAFQAMPEGGKLRLKAEHRENKVVLRVEDNGKGITEEEMPRLFEPFFTSRKMGSGLGLAICQKIVEEHQGQIRVERVKPHGAAFIIELPLSKETGS